MKYTCAIEISEHYIKVAAVRGHGSSRPSIDFFVEPTAGLTDEQISETIARIFRQNRLKPGNLSLCLSRNQVTVRNLHLPSQDKKEMTQMIDLNVVRIVPYKKEEIVFDYLTLGADEMGYTKVLLAIVHGNTIRRQSRILEKAGFMFEDIHLSSHSVWEWIIGHHRTDIGPSDLYLFLDIDAKFTDFVVFSQSNLLFSRSINVGAEGLRQEGQTGSTRLMGEVKQSLVMFYNEETNKKPAAVFLSGAHVGSEFRRFIEIELGIPVKSAVEPALSGESVPQKAELFRDVSLTPLAALVSGSSGRQITFVLPEIQIKKSLKEKTRELFILGVALTYLLTVFCALFFGRIYSLQSYINRLNRGYAGLQKELGDLPEQMSKVEFVKAYLDSRRLPLYVISKLQEIIPDGISVSSLLIDEQEKITIRGQALELSGVFAFINTMEKEKSFRDIQTKYTRKKRVKDRDVTDFELSFSVGTGYENTPARK
jgi:Tfp pilus assembly PilM family ATPase/Tfp pilus assembly protein PilN